MKKTLTLTESELVKVVNRIVESYTDDMYNDEDYIEVFLQYFRPWVRKNHGDEIGEYPLSYLTKKYMKEFAKDIGLSPENVIFGYKGTLGNASNIGKNLVKQGNHKMPSLRSQEKFTEKFKKPLEFFVNELNLPEVNHKDTNKMNNNISNLEWITHQQNIEHAFHNNLYVKGSKKWNSKLTEEDVLWVRKNHIPKHFQFSAKSLSIKFNVSAATIHKIIHNKTWT